jgi:hypothetical protein
MLHKSEKDKMIDDLIEKMKSYKMNHHEGEGDKRKWWKEGYNFAIKEIVEELEKSR